MSIEQCPECQRLFTLSSAGGGVPGGKEREDALCPRCGAVVYSEMTSAVFLVGVLTAEDEARELVRRAVEQGRFNRGDLLVERDRLGLALQALTKIMSDLPWADVGPLYDQIGRRREVVDLLLHASR